MPVFISIIYIRPRSDFFFLVAPLVACLTRLPAEATTARTTKAKTSFIFVVVVGTGLLSVRDENR